MFGPRSFQCIKIGFGFCEHLFDKRGLSERLCGRFVRRLTTRWCEGHGKGRKCVCHLSLSPPCERVCGFESQLLLPAFSPYSSLRPPMRACHSISDAIHRLVAGIAGLQRGQNRNRNTQVTRPSHRGVGNLQPESVRHVIARMPSHAAIILLSLWFCDLLCAVRGESVSSQFAIIGAQIETKAASPFHVTVSGPVQVCWLTLLLSAPARSHWQPDEHTHCVDPPSVCRQRLPPPDLWQWRKTTAMRAISLLSSFRSPVEATARTLL
jgi:hypothetical protein